MFKKKQKIMDEAPKTLGNKENYTATIDNTEANLRLVRIYGRNTKWDFSDEHKTITVSFNDKNLYDTFLNIVNKRGFEENKYLQAIKEIINNIKTHPDNWDVYWTEKDYCLGANTTIKGNEIKIVVNYLNGFSDGENDVSYILIKTKSGKHTNIGPGFDIYYHEQLFNALSELMRTRDNLIDDVISDLKSDL